MKVSSTMDEQIQRAAAALREADALLVGAGAGMGVDSGLPDFRGTEGFWRAYPVIAKLGLSFAEMANPVWFESDPHLAWAFYGHRLNLYRRTEPHRGFAYLLELGSRKAHGCWVFTSNVDGHFRRRVLPPSALLSVMARSTTFNVRGRAATKSGKPKVKRSGLTKGRSGLWTRFHAAAFALRWHDPIS